MIAPACAAGRPIPDPLTASAASGALNRFPGSVAAEAGKGVWGAAGLRAWLDEAARVSVRTGDTVDVVSGNASVPGNVVQARDIGSVSLG